MEMADFPTLLYTLDGSQSPIMVVSVRSSRSSSWHCRKPFWMVAASNARSRQSNGKIGDCEQSMYTLTSEIRTLSCTSNLKKVALSGG